MKHLATISAVLSPLVSPGLMCAQQTAGADSGLLGCYSITWAQGQRTKPFFPDTISLSARPAKWNDGGHAVSVSRVWAKRTSISQYLWVQLGPDSLLILQTDGFNGVSLVLKRSGTGWRGTATSFRDVIDSLHPFPTWQAALQRLDAN